MCVLPFTNRYGTTFLFSFTENGIMVSDGQQRDVIIVNNELWVFKATVCAQEVIDSHQLSRTELVAENNVEDLSRPVIVVWQTSFTQLLSSAVELPIDMLDCDEDKSYQLVNNSRYKPLSHQPIA